MFENFLEALKKHSETSPAKTALCVKRGGEYVKYSYARFYELVCSVSNALIEKGVAKNDFVGLFSENSPEWVIAYFSIYASGAAVVPLDAQYTARELSNLLPFAGVKTIFCSSNLYDKTVKSLNESLKFENIFLTDDSGGANSMFKMPVHKGYRVSRSPEDRMSLIFTSGTTGDPKGVVLTDKNFHSNVSSIIAIGGIMDESDVVLTILPLHHCFSFTATVLLPLMLGASLTFQPSLKGPDILEAINETKVTKMAGVPQLFSIFEKNIFAKTEKLSFVQKKIFNLLFGLSEKIYDKTGYMAGKLLFKKVTSAFGDNFRFFVSGGAKLDAKTAKNLAVVGLEILEGYGLTETAPVLTLNPPGAARIGSCGKPLPDVEMKILNPDRDGVGEIIARGPNLMQGYYKHPESTAEVVKDGWFYTGDLGYFDKDGYLFITGRAKDVIVMASGKNVYPDEVEKHYQQCPYVAEMCVMGEETSDGRIEKLKAIVVPNYRLLREQNIANCTSHIKCSFEELAIKIPTYMRINDFKIISEELPRTRLGKLKRSEIKKRGLFDRAGDDAVKKPELTQEEKELMSVPIAEKLVERLKRLTGKQELFPSDNLELDLGVDSLTRLELLVILDSEFGLKIKENEAASLIHLKDILERVIKDGSASSASPGGASGLLGAMRKEPETPFESAYNLQPGFFGWAFKWKLKKAAWLFFQATCGVEIEGMENIKHKKAFLLCPNHTSFIDPVIMFAALKDFYSRRMFFFALEEMFGGPMLAWFRRLFKIITSGTEDSMVRSLQYSSKALAAGFPICIFPEGQRTIDETVVKPKKGFAILACEHKAPIYPVYIKGAINMFSKPNPGFKPGPLKIKIGRPIMPPDKDEYCDSDYEALMLKWHEAVNGLGRALNPKNIEPGKN
ncbi:MAG: Long-chain-fatty-acid--CoA ligase [bacterium ADurb.Bin243]|nr:MAG: Long-chain-fatty-acid--CoA ligase [bacterium ADurb.Bin243]